MTQAMTAAENTAAVMESVIMAGDLARLTPLERVGYYRAVCESMGLNPLSQPFAYITLNGKLTLYATRTATDQLRSIRNVSIEIISRERIDEVFVVTARARTADGRTDEEIGAVAIGNLRGENLANAMMKAQTKAKRRVTLSICGLGWLDESEVDSVPSARPAHVDTETGEIVRTAPSAPAAGAQAWVGELSRTLKLHGLRVGDLCEVIPVPEITRANATAVVGHFLDAEGMTPAQLVQAVLTQREARATATVTTAAIVDPPEALAGGPSLRDRISSAIPDTDNDAFFDSAMADEMDRLGLSTADLARAIGTQATPAAVREYVTRTKGSASQLCEMAAEMKRRHVAAGKV